MFVKTKKRLIAEMVHEGIFHLLCRNVGSDKAYAIASGFCPAFDSDFTGGLK